MSNFDDLMKKYVNKSYGELLEVAKTAVNRLLPVCKSVDPKNDGRFMLMSIVLSAIASDDILTALERSFIKDLLNISDNEVNSMISNYDSDMAGLTDKFADDISDKVKSAVMALIVCISSVDEKISREETAFIKKIGE